MKNFMLGYMPLDMPEKQTNQVIESKCLSYSESHSISRASEPAALYSPNSHEARGALPPGTTQPTHRMVTQQTQLTRFTGLSHPTHALTRSDLSARSHSLMLIPSRAARESTESATRH